MPGGAPQASTRDADVSASRPARNASPLAARVLGASRRKRSWLQLARFSIVGASGYVVNLASFALLIAQPGIDYRVAATGAFLVAVTNNFLWNRRWTFGIDGAGAFRHARRFLCVSVLAFAFNLAILSLLVGALGLGELISQAVAIVCATPLSFLGNKLWTFQR